jgi:ribulose-phosphate 3-epimerase
MCADLCNVERDVGALEEAGVDWLHFDIMDGRFVPNITLGPDFVRAVRGISDLPLDVHLMVEQPERYIAEFLDAGSDVLAIHVEATRHVRRTLQLIREGGAQAGLCLNPATPLDAVEYAADLTDMLVVMTVDPGFAGQKLIPATLPKIAAARELLVARQSVDFGDRQRSVSPRNPGEMLRPEIQVDGNVSFEHAPKMVAQGATVLVAGSSSVFQKGLTVREGVKRLRAAVADAQAPSGR